MGLVLAGLAGWMRLDSDSDAGVEGLKVGGASTKARSTESELAGVKGSSAARAVTQDTREAGQGTAASEPGFGEYKRVAHTLNIKLVGPNDGELAARIEVSPRIQGTRAEPQTKLAVAGGWTSFEFPDPVPVLIRVSEYPAGLLPPVEAHDDRGAEGDEGVFTLDKVLLPGANSMLIRLCAGASIEGLVADETGAGMAGALVSVHLRGQGLRQVLRANTGEDGRYSIPCQPGSHRVVLAVGQGTIFPWQGSPAPIDVQLNPGQVAIADFSMHGQGATISGVVVDGEGQPYAFLRIAALHRSRAGRAAGQEGRRYRDIELAQSTRTGPDGSFRLAGLQEGRIELEYGLWPADGFGKEGDEERASTALHDVRPTDHLDVGVVTVPRPKPVKVVGTVALVLSADGQSVDADQLELRASFEPLNAVGPNLQLDNRPRGEPVPLTQEAGRLTFEWTSSFPTDSVYFELSGPGDQRVYRHVSLVPGIEKPVLLQFPPTKD